MAMMYDASQGKNDPCWDLRLSYVDKEETQLISTYAIFIPNTVQIPQLCSRRDRIGETIHCPSEERATLDDM